jgi:hypothetical protein
VVSSPSHGFFFFLWWVEHRKGAPGRLPVLLRGKAIDRRLDGKDPLIEIKGIPPTTPWGPTIIIWQCHTFVRSSPPLTVGILYFSLTFTVKWQLGIRSACWQSVCKQSGFAVKFVKETNFLYIFNSKNFKFKQSVCFLRIYNAAKYTMCKKLDFFAVLSVVLSRRW